MLLNRAHFDQIWRIMEPSFPRDERRPREEQEALFEEPAYRVYGAVDECGAVIAFIAAWDLGEVLFIEHFAVDPARRNGGIGSKLLSEVVGETKKTVCLEVELPECELARRRIGFYERNGFYYNDYPYVQPAMSEGQGTLPLRVMTSGSAVSYERFAEIKNLLYKEIYHTLEN